MVGKQVQQYTFLEKLGAGGMGDIYRAQDTRLNRFVAIKVLVGTASSDPDRRRRFIQEAQAASALNHPNIITIHDIITDGDAQYMVMEHVQGKTLADMIPKGGLRVPQVLKLAMQMTDALQTAHSAGIIHRDLKPGNVMVTETGLVKVLDFGLAKLTDPAPVTQQDETRTMGPAPLTVEGSIIGTVSYMSPEQAQGKKVDTRSDIFSFGVVLYEMITGTRAFHADTTVGTLSAILRDDVRPIADIAPDVPPKLEQVVTRSLMKNPDDRFQTMRDMHLALGALKHESDSGVLYRSMVMTASEIQLPAGKPPSAAQVKAATVEKAASSKVMMLGIAAAAGIAIVGGIVWTQMGKSPEQTAVATPPAVTTPAPVTPPPVVEEKLNNDGIIQMVKAKVPLEVIYSQLRTAPNAFNLSAGEVIRLTNEGVPLSVIEGMRDPSKIPATVAKVTPKGSEKASTATGPAAINPTAAPIVLPPPPTAEVVVPRPAAPPSVAAAGATKQVVLADGSPFAIALTADIPENAKEGTQLRFTVVNDVRVGDSLVIAKGSLATGQITQAKGRLMGKMQLRLLTVTGVDGKINKIRALSSRSNKNQERPVDTGVKPKTDKAAADAGTQYIAYVDGDMTVAVRGK